MTRLPDLLDQLGILPPPRPNIETRIKLAITPLRHLLLRARFERIAAPTPSLLTRLRAWRHGFSSLAFRLYQLDCNDPRLYLPESAAINDTLLHHHRRAIDDKLVFSHLMRLFGRLHPRVVAFIRSGRLLELEGPGRQVHPVDWLDASLRAGDRVVFKPVSGMGGRGIFFVKRSEGGFEINHAPRSRAVLDALLASLDQYLVTEFVQQAPYSAQLYSSTPNTVRVLTLWDYARGCPFIAAAAHRIGTSRCRLVDSFHQGRGGLVAAIDIESGVLGAAAMTTTRGEVIRHHSHPETGSDIAGIQVPFWDETKRQLLEVAAALPESPHIGWDLLMTEVGASWLEANSGPGLYIWQINTPLLKDPRVRAFYESHDMI